MERSTEDASGQEMIGLLIKEADLWLAFFRDAQTDVPRGEGTPYDIAKKRLHDAAAKLVALNLPRGKTARLRTEIEEEARRFQDIEIRWPD